MELLETLNLPVLIWTLLITGFSLFATGFIVGNKGRAKEKELLLSNNIRTPNKQTLIQMLELSAIRKKATINKNNFLTLGYFFLLLQGIVAMFVISPIIGAILVAMQSFYIKSQFQLQKEAIQDLLSIEQALENTKTQQTKTTT